MTRILHTADWHLGARLMENERSEEHRLFLEWLLEVMRCEKPDVLLVAGDVFDTSNPPQSALSDYYDFLADVRVFTPTRVIITGGNHDSPLTLNAPAGVLGRMDVHVHGCPPEKIDHCISVFADAVICAVPFLRERDVRVASPGQSSEQIAAEIRSGISRYYRSIFKHAQKIAQGRAIVTSGHLTAVGATTSDSEREIHIGSLGAVDATCFAGFDYVALGHLHKPQQVGSHPHVRYAGSPVPLSFDDAENEKSVVLLDLQKGRAPIQRLIPIPRFRTLARVQCTAETLLETFQSVKAAAQPDHGLTPWVELTLACEDGSFDPERRIREAAESAGVAVLKCLLSRVTDAWLSIPDGAAETPLSQMAPALVFAERLHAASIDPLSTEGAALSHTFAELLSRMSAAEQAEPAR